MAWSDEMPIIVRGLIQDWGSPPVYSDDQVKQIILIAAQSVQNDATFVERYDVDVVAQTIVPDFTDRTTGHRNEAFINLIALKSGCILVGAEIRKYTGQGISIRDGSSAVSLQRSPESLKLMQSTYCSAYADALYNYKVGGGTDGEGGGPGEAIVGPYKFFEGCGPDGYGYIDGGSTYGGSLGRSFNREWWR